MRNQSRAALQRAFRKQSLNRRMPDLHRKDRKGKKTTSPYVVKVVQDLPSDYLATLYYRVDEKKWRRYGAIAHITFKSFWQVLVQTEMSFRHGSLRTLEVSLVKEEGEQAEIPLDFVPAGRWARADLPEGTIAPSGLSLLLRDTMGALFNRVDAAKES